MDSRVIALFSWLNRFRLSKDFSEIFLSAITFTFYLSHLMRSAMIAMHFMIKIVKRRQNTCQCTLCRYEV